MQLSFCLAVFILSDWSIPNADYVRVTEVFWQIKNNNFLKGINIFLLKSENCPKKCKKIFDIEGSIQSVGGRIDTP